MARARVRPRSVLSTSTDSRPPQRSPYVAGLRLLARRELSEHQVRERLLRQGYDEAAIDLAVARLKDERALDDARAAETWARAALATRTTGRLRIARELAQAGIDQTLIRTTLARLFADVDENGLIAAAVERRLRGRPLGADPKARQRLYRYLVRQGFSSDAITQTLARAFGTIAGHDVD